MKRFVGLIQILLVCFCASSSLWADTGRISATKLLLTGIPAPERPAKAAELVKAAKVDGREALTRNIVREALALNGTAAPSVVSAIARSVPEMAAVAAGSAVECEPAQAADITRAAAAAAPDRVEQIVAAVCRVAPGRYGIVARAAGDAAPGSVRQIFQGVAVSVPELRTPIDRTLSRYQGNPPPVPVVLDTLGFSGRPLRGVNMEMRERGAGDSPGLPPVPPVSLPPTPPVSLPPTPPVTLPPTSSVTNVPPSTSGNVPRGGRNYASP